MSKVYDENLQEMNSEERLKLLQTKTTIELRKLAKEFSFSSEGNREWLIYKINDSIEKEQICDLCGKSRKYHNLKGFIYFHGDDDNLKAGWSCVEEIVRKNKITLEKYIENKKPTKLERDIRNNDRSLEGWSKIILGRD